MSMTADALREITRRHFFRQTGFGIGSLALSSLLHRELRGQEASLNPMAPRKPHFAAKAKNVIYLFMMGAPSQLAAKPLEWGGCLRMKRRSAA